MWHSRGPKAVLVAMAQEGRRAHARARRPFSSLDGRWEQGAKVAQQDGWLYPRPSGLYDPSFEHDACGVGFVARVSGQPGHDIVAKAVEAVANLSHRGAVAADGKSGDGSGVLTQLPHKLLAREAERLFGSRI